MYLLHAAMSESEASFSQHRFIWPVQQDVPSAGLTVVLLTWTSLSLQWFLESLLTSQMTHFSVTHWTYNPQNLGEPFHVHFGMVEPVGQQ